MTINFSINPRFKQVCLVWVSSDHLIICELNNMENLSLKSNAHLTKYYQNYSRFIFTQHFYLVLSFAQSIVFD